jgi:hypothetical protein
MALATVCKIIPNIRYFDVSMRDVSLSKTLPEKQIMIDTIMKKYKPHALEIGSPIQKITNSYKLYQYASTIYNKNSIYNRLMKSNMISHIYHPCDFYLLIPPIKKYINIAQKLNIKNISLYTSIQNQSMQETKANITNILKKKDKFDKFNKFDNVKLYVSCSSDIHNSGKKNNDNILNELYEYIELDGVNEICISDTRRTMTQDDFIYIIDNLSKNKDTMDKMDKISLQLHMNDGNGNSNSNIDNIIENIIEYALINNINKFNVSSLNNSNISITSANGSKLTYDRLNTILRDFYI